MQKKMYLLDGQMKNRTVLELHDRITYLVHGAESFLRS